MKMKHMTVALVSAAIMSVSLLHADEGPAPTAKDLSKAVDETYFVETSQPGIVLSGYVDAGYIYNFIGRGTTVQGRGYTTDTRAGGDFNVNQVKLALEKELAKGDEFEAGFRVDLIYGEDAGDLGTNNGGLNQSDDFDLQQAYVSLYLPVGNGLELWVGKWQALIGWEAEERVDNFNITGGFSATPDPAWYTGVAAVYSLTDNIEVILGVGNGSGLDNGPGADSISDEYSITGVATYTNTTGNASTSVGFHWAPVGDTGYGQTENEPGLVLNWLGAWQPLALDEKLTLGFNTSFATFQDFAPGNTDADSSLVVAALYGKYYFNDTVSFAGRAEYLHAWDNKLLGATGPGGVNPESTDWWGLTGTLGFDLADDLLLRFEYRTDFGNDIRNIASDGTTGDVVHTIASQIVYSF